MDRENLLGSAGERISSLLDAWAPAVRWPGTGRRNWSGR